MIYAGQGSGRYESSWVCAAIAIHWPLISCEPTRQHAYTGKLGRVRATDVSVVKGAKSIWQNV